MTTPVLCQRWRERKASYRRIGSDFRPADHDVQELAGVQVARAFIEEHHYSGTFPAARFQFALARHGELAGVAVFSVPASNAVLTRVFSGEATDSVELGRLVLLDEVPGNAESWFVARCFELLRDRVPRGVVSFSDDMPRTDVHGRVIFAGHIGIIYQALNAVYLGRGRGGPVKLLPDGRVFSRPAEMKIRSGRQGWKYAVRQLEAAGANPLDGGDPVEWLNRELPLVTRVLRHPGNHKYCWGLHRGVARRLPKSKQYPKRAVVL